MKGKTIWVLQLFVASILGHASSLLIPVFASNIVLYVTNNNSNLAYLNILFLIITYLAYDLFWYWNYVAYSYNFKYCYKNLREKIINKVFTYDNYFTTKISKATILNTVNGDTPSLSEMADEICEIIVVFVKLIVVIIIFLKTNFYIGIAVLILEYLYLKSYDYCNIKVTKHLYGQRKYADKLTENLQQILNGLDEIKIFNIHNKIKKNFYIIADKWSDKYMQKRKYTNIREALLPGIVHFGKILLYLVITYLVLNGTYDINVLILLISYFESIMEDSEDLMDYSGIIREYSVCIKRINTVLNYTPDKEIEFGINENDYINGLVEFKKVSFTYKNKNSESIKNVSFIAKPNEITALVGHSGSGKSTIINLLLRTYKIDSGLISIDNENIYNYSKNIYSKNIVAVNQFPFIFNMSIKKNLSLIDNNFDHQVEACKRVGIHDYIMSLPKGYNTILNENASSFSGGQRQLLAIARTLLSKAEILIFDEITSSLDPTLVENVKEILTDLAEDHTVILITHKKDVMKVADKIIVLNDGKIVGEGTHKELMKNNEYYIDIQTHNYSSSHKKIINFICFFAIVNISC